MILPVAGTSYVQFPSQNSSLTGLAESPDS